MSLQLELQDLLQDVKNRFSQCKTDEEKESLRRSTLGRKGQLATLFDQLQHLSVSERKEAGAVANHVRDELEKLFGSNENAALTNDQYLAAHRWSEGMLSMKGLKHPLTQFLERIMDVFVSFGFSVVDSPELEDERHNFDLLNIPPDHPSRDQWDTFFVKRPNAKPDALLRTHTSPMQIRVMNTMKPPVRIIVPGRVFRHEATDASHESTFYQCEGFVIDKKISLADLMGTLKTLIESLYGKSVAIRFRPHYYPFVEPGMDVDMQLPTKSGKKAWLEMLGSGMIHPEVLKNMGVDPSVYSGFAFGLGVDRLAMLYYGVDDVRSFLSGSVDVLEQMH